MLLILGIVQLLYLLIQQNGVNGTSVTTSSSQVLKYYKFVAPKSGSYTIQTKDATFDTYGYLYTSSKKLVTALDKNPSDDNGIGRNFRIDANLTTGQTYYVGVAGFGSNYGTCKLFINFDDDNTLEVALFEVGRKQNTTVIDNYETAFNSRGYTTLLKRNNITGTAPTATTIRSYGVNADILVIAGHGYTYGAVPIYASNTASSYSSYLCARSSAIPDGKLTYEVGADFLSGSTTKTNSVWKTDLDWVIFQCCSQLSYGNDSAEGTEFPKYDGLYAAQIWARAMLGDGNRIHGMLGYSGSAPGADSVLERISLSMKNSISSGASSYINLWKTANEPLFAGNSSWAAIAHRDNVNDSVIYTRGNTNNDDNYIIDRYCIYNNQSSIRLTGTSSNTQTNDMIDEVSNENTNIKFYQDSYNNNYANLLEDNNFIKNNYASLTGDNKSIQKKDLLMDKQSMMEIILEVEDQEDDSYSFEIASNGKIEYVNALKEFTASEPLSISKEDAVNQVVEKLSQLGLMPEEDYIINVSTTIRQVIETSDPETYPIGVEEVMAYDVKLIHTLNNRSVFSNDKEGIYVTVTDNGISNLSYKWTDLEQYKDINSFKSEEESNIQSLTGIYAENIYELWDTPKQDYNVYTSEAYMIDDNEELREIVLFDLGEFGQSRSAYYVDTEELVQ